MFMYKIRADHGFRDGNVYPRALQPGEVVVVDEQTYHKMSNSDPDSITLVEKVIPNPKKAANAKPTS